ncbi:MAG: hypothetical protein R6X09_00005 [Bacteroidales bacterium]
MKPIIILTFLITLMLTGTPVLHDTLPHTGSDKSAAETTLTTGTQDAEKSNATADKPCVQSANMQLNTNEAAATLPGKNTANLIIIL